MNVLIVGGAGFIGSQTAKTSRPPVSSSVVFDNMSSGHRWALRWGAFEEGDIGDRPTVDRVLAEHSIDAVIHLASFIQVGESVREPRKYFQNNLAATLTLLDAMVARGVRSIVFSSSAAVYGNPVRVPLDEEHPIEPLSPYGDSKMFVERILRWYGDAYGLRWAALRYFNAAGADPDGELGEEHQSESHLIPLALRAALGGPALSVFGTDYPTRDGTAIRDYIHVADLSDAHVLAVRHLVAGGASFTVNVGTGIGHSVQEVITSAERIAGRPVVRQAVARRGGRLARARRRRQENQSTPGLAPAPPRARRDGRPCPSLDACPTRAFTGPLMFVALLAGPTFVAVATSGASQALRSGPRRADEAQSRPMIDFTIFFVRLMRSWIPRFNRSAGIVTSPRNFSSGRARKIVECDSPVQCSGASRV